MPSKSAVALGRANSAGLWRRTKLLESARELLRTTRLSELSLAEVARNANVPKGSAYFFYPDINALYGALLGVVDNELQAILRRPLKRSSAGWQDVVGALIDRGREFFAENPAARQLIVGIDTPPALKLRDRAHDVELGKVFEQHVARRFVLPNSKNRSVLFYRAIEIADLMFCLSMSEHGRITPAYGKEAKKAAIAYLECYLPVKLPPIPEESA